ncbi:GrxA family glutaredoxin [Marinobacter vinifirmus]|jgi:glutaredoxin 1|uniref:GrxA family glutaredoxin n=2 Tax=Marinobacter TaxID=2742 RepID=A0A259W1L4_9GAMM|nr:MULTISPECIES: GrxA family glutaredoxin [Marinobacter]OZC36497.1 GrxA family glutaredoxin [Marinobacter vinifirmus]TVT32178.1 MAG: GrxA family glutaredoxin [Marinobacter vinifirmus]|tara:strand:- start:323 stop:565 length:243 start_codon:yes stop_codon:yes gene_type:complete
MEQVTIYGRMSCPFCVAAKNLCESRNMPYVWVDMIEKGLSKQDVADRIGRPVYTVPQILVGDEYVGGYDDFSAYVRRQPA